MHCPAVLLPVGLLHQRLKSCYPRTSVHEFNLIYHDAVMAQVFRHIEVPSQAPKLRGKQPAVLPGGFPRSVS